MKKIFKSIILIALIFSFFSIGLTKAQSQLQSKSDCELLMGDIYNNKQSFEHVDLVRETNGYKYSKFLTISQQKDIIDKESLNRAILNLKKYCYDKVANKDQKKERKNLYEQDKSYIESEANTLDSPYLFDHIFDIFMRKYSGITGEAYGLSVDSSGAEWRELMTQFATNTGGDNPQNIINKYKSIRYTTTGLFVNGKIEDVIIKENQNNLLDYLVGPTEEGKEITENLTKYKDRTLVDKYNNVCGLSLYFYALILRESSSSLNLQGKIEKCNQIAKNQINNETFYTNLVIQKASNRFQNNYINEYVTYLDDRKDKLDKKRKDTADKFTFISRAVPQIVHNCRK